MRKILSDVLCFLTILTVVLQVVFFNIVLHGILCSILIFVCILMIVIDIKKGYPETIWHPAICGALWLVNLIVHLV